MKNYFSLAVFLSVLLVFSAQARDNKSRVQVVGKAIVKAIPENINVRIPVVIRNADYAVCARELDNTVAELQEQIAKSGLDKDVVKTSGYTISENYEYRNGTREREGYIGRMTLLVNEKYSVDLYAKLSKVLESNEAVFNVNFILSEEQKEALNEEAIRKAVDDARTKASIIASESGVELVKISNIVYDYSNFRPDVLIRGRSMQEAAGAVDAGGQVAINPEELTVEKMVQIEWIIKNR